jgi:hypothetical protein
VESVDFLTLSIVQYLKGHKRTQRFGNCVCFDTPVSETLCFLEYLTMGKVQKLNDLNDCTSPSGRKVEVTPVLN